MPNTGFTVKQCWLENLSNRVVMKTSRWFMVVGTLTPLLLSPTGFLPAHAETDPGSIEVLDEIVVVGSRRQDRRAVVDSMVPVDIIDGDQLRSQGAMNMDALLAMTVSSFNVDQQAINDAATLVRPARMRGLPPDSTLTLINGKRRHRAAVLTFLGNGVADGSQGPDLSVIPAIAVKRVEVLRDGASGNCRPIRVIANVASGADKAAVESNPDCYSFISAFPGGFTPRFGGTLTDFSAALGCGADWRKTGFST